MAWHNLSYYNMTCNKIMNCYKNNINFVSFNILLVTFNIIYSLIICILSNSTFSERSKRPSNFPPKNPKYTWYKYVNGVLLSWDFHQHCLDILTLAINYWLHCTVFKETSIELLSEDEALIGHVTHVLFHNSVLLMLGI